MKERILNLLDRQLARQGKLTGGTGSLSQEDEGDESETFFPVENFLEEVSDAFGMVSYSDLYAGFRIRIRIGSGFNLVSGSGIRIRNPDPDPGGQK